MLGRSQDARSGKLRERTILSADKAARYVHIAELFLEEDETVEAERYVNRASQFIHECPDVVIKTKHRVSHARILDSKRKFLEAATSYYKLSLTELGSSSHVAEDDVIQLLVCAITCAVLASAGPQRSRILGTLFSDERSKQTGIHWNVLNKMYTERLMRRADIEEFEEALLPHQKATLADGSSVLERAMIEHNMLAASRIYKNIRFDELGVLLETSTDSAENISAKMISEGRMEGTIDQVDGLLKFNKNNQSISQPILDSRIQSFCNELNALCDHIF